ncbi:dehydrogenase/reductase SDR family member 4-like [Apostichopus japonicus]|uniref:dehydrogenase/reductase SDR family member 4-like n=1 Tax=Stichopus japonicus TaxID=307972 RepID=UPI003AB6A96F
MPLERFAGKVAILTGSTSGIGLASAKRLGLEGCKVIVSSRKEVNVQAAVKTLKDEGIEVAGIASDQAVMADRKKLIKFALDKYGQLDCVFLSAGSSPHNGSLLDVTEKEFHNAFALNVKANFQFIQECLPAFDSKKGGSILTNATAAAYESVQIVTKNILLYCVSKLCLISVTQHVARDLFNRNIRINCVAPGLIKTPFLQGGLGSGHFKKYADITGIKLGVDAASRLGEPEEIASVAAFLLSSDASYINGQILIAGGGFPLLRAF